MTSRKDRNELLNEAEAEILTFTDEISGLIPEGPLDDDPSPTHMWSTIKLVREFLDIEAVRRSYLEAPPAYADRQPLNEAFLQALIGHLRAARAYFTESENLKLPVRRYSAGAAPIFSDIRELIHQAFRRLRRGEGLFLSTDDILKLSEQMEGISERLRLLDASASVVRSLDKITTATEKAESSAAKASTAAGRAGGDTIASFYQTFADGEKAAANTYRNWTIWAGVGAGLTAAAFLILPEFGPLRIEANDYVHLIQRVVVTAAVFGMAGYFARQAHQHRVLANWASAMAVQLKTFEAYVDPIEDQAVRDELRKTFAGRAFGDHPAMKGEASPSPTPAAIEAAMQLLAKITPGTK